jgi:macrolide transport system ATP-binding/permease protein
VDEPTNYLDMPSVEALQQMFSQYEGTLVFVSHDRIFINEIATDLLIVKNGKIHGFHGNYKAYEESLKKEKSKDNKDILIVAAEMKRTVILAEFSNPRADKEALEEEYENVMNELKLLRGNFIE